MSGRPGTAPTPVSPDWPLASSLELAALDTAPSCARLHARHVLADWELNHLTASAELLISELLTNSVKASSPHGTPVRLRLLTDHRQLIIEAWDRNPNPPQSRQADYADESGRGLNVITAIARRWGYYSSGKWKVVWAEILTGTDQETTPGHLLRQHRPQTRPILRQPQDTAGHQQRDNPTVTRTPSAASKASRWFAIVDGARVRQLRHQRGLSPAELAGQAGIGLSTVTRLERVRERRCRTRTLARLAAVLGQPPAAFIASPPNLTG
jgi:anti-sigma regulatory factor (Ser/Thr protein kinase)/DNA-binding Xre family transcriptional regulator